MSNKIERTIENIQTQMHAHAHAGTHTHLQMLFILTIIKFTFFGDCILIFSVFDSWYNVQEYKFKAVFVMGFL